MRAPDRNDQRGFTLIELMISLVIFSFAVAGVLSVAVSITQGFREQRQAIAAEQAARVPLDFLADALRQTSPGMSQPSLVEDVSDATCYVGAIKVDNDYGGLGPDRLEIIYATGAVVATTTSDFDGGDVTVSDVSELAIDDYVLITNFSAGHLFKIIDITGSTLTLQGGTCSGTTFTSYVKGATLIRARHARFYVANLDNIPTLWMDPDADGPDEAEPLAEGIEDMQIALGYDEDANKTISDSNSTTDEWHYNVALDSAPGSSDNIRAVRITLVARATQALIGGTSTPYNRPAAEDHAAGSPDAYRRRVLRTIVDLRNVGGSP